ncbi:MAG: 1,4-dihydroxy-2-naphthoate polyprenyltransferase [Deltaproteobacteria bacterium]|nr:1,4-dihydroxy-2-naphthoate polyprenyltransferase [Deltaproteobacteria bacterium]
MSDGATDDHRGGRRDGADAGAAASVPRRYAAGTVARAYAAATVRGTTGLAPWLAAARPRTLPAAIVPVVVGLAFAARTHALDAGVAVVTLVAALLIQIGTNLANDYYDFVAGADTHERLGPRRITQAGLAAPATVRAAAFVVLAAAGLAGAYLVAVGGWPILLIGMASLAAAVAYTGGPFPLAYHGLGDLFVFVFFGVVAVAGTVWLQTGALAASVLAPSLPVACLATAILVVNNLRDIATDARAGKRTLAVRLGAAATRAEYVALVAAPYAVVGAVAAATGAAGLLLPFATAPLAVREARAIFRRAGAELNASLAGTARLHLLFGVLLAAGLLA